MDSLSVQRRGDLGDVQQIGIAGTFGSAACDAALATAERPHGDEPVDGVLVIGAYAATG
jgi:hypothetical protein